MNLSQPLQSVSLCIQSDDSEELATLTVQPYRARHVADLRWGRLRSLLA